MSNLPFLFTVMPNRVPNVGKPWKNEMVVIEFSVPNVPTSVVGYVYKGGTNILCVIGKSSSS